MRFWIPILSLFLALFGVIAKGEAPATQPTSQPAEFSADAPARKWFADLASADASKRDEAQTNLMGLSRDDLPALRELIIKTRPPAPAQVAALHDVVIHVFLAGESYPPEVQGPDARQSGFLGLRWLENSNQAMAADEIPQLGVPVEIRLPGFPGFRALRDGDLILGMVHDPHKSLQEMPNLPTPTRRILTAEIALAGADQEVMFEVLRQGQVVRVSLRLFPRPASANGLDNPDIFTNDRQRRAEEYWQQQFSPLLHQDS